MSPFHESQASQPGGSSSCRQLPSTFMPQPRWEEIPNSALPIAIITWGWRARCQSLHNSESRCGIQLGFSCWNLLPVPLSRENGRNDTESKSILFQMKISCPIVLLPVGWAARVNWDGLLPLAHFSKDKLKKNVETSDFQTRNHIQIEFKKW